MSEAETVRLVVEAIVGLSGLGTGFWFLLKNLWKAHRLMESATAATQLNTAETRELKEQMAEMNHSVREHSELDDVRFGGISQRLSHMEGKLGMPLGGKEEEIT